MACFSFFLSLDFLIILTTIKIIKFNAKNKVEKRLQKQKLSRMLDECLYLNEKVEYEMIKAFQDYQKKLSEMKIKTLIEQGYINSDELEM